MSGHLIQPILSKDYPVAVEASGIWITDSSGKRFLDGSSGAITCSLGHSHPKVIAALKNQSEKLQFVYRSQFSSAPAEELAKKLFELSPGNSYAYTFFVNSGTEAMETAMKTAWQYWQELGKSSKRFFISRKKSYHGITMGALSLSGHPLRRKRFDDLLDPYPQLESDLENDPVESQLAELQQVIDRLGASSIAAFVAEPVVGAAGAAIHPPDGYYQKVKALCKSNDLLFIADEVMTGLGRTGKWFGLDHWNSFADIVAIGKSLGAGYAPIAATLMTADVVDAIRRGSNLIMSGHTYSGHPLSSAVALEVLNTIEQDGLLENVEARGYQLLRSLDALSKQFSLINKVRGKGLMLGLELDPSVSGLQNNLISQCFTNGLLVYPSVGGPQGKDENSILIAPPFIISERDTESLVDLLEKSLRRL